MFINATCTHDHRAVSREHYQFGALGQPRSWELGPIGVSALRCLVQSYTLVCRVYTLITQNLHVEIVITVEHHRTVSRVWQKSVMS